MSEPNSKSIKIQAREYINYNSIQQSNEMLLYNTFKFYFDIDLENNIISIDNAKNSLNTLLNNYKNDYIQTLQESIAKNNLKTLKASKEYLALLHIQYLGENGQVFGQSFKQALKEKSHLKLWYEIRYNSNIENDKSIAIKRFKQSNLFGLYENNDINDKIFQSLGNTSQNLFQDKATLNEAMIFFEFLNITKSSTSQTYYKSIIKKEEKIKKNFTDDSFPLSQSLDIITQPFLNTMKQYYPKENNPNLKIESIYIIQKSKDKPNVTDNIATINKRMQQNNSPLFFIFYPQSIGDIALQIRQKSNSTLYLIVCKDTKIDCTYLDTNSRLYLSDFKDEQNTNYFLGTEIKNNTESTKELTPSQQNDYIELDKNGNDIADYQQEYIFKNAEPILTIKKHQSNIMLYNIGFSKQNHIISNEISKNQTVNKLGIKLKLKEEKSHSTDCSKEGNFTLYINELYIYCSTNQHSYIQHNHNNEANSNESNDSIQDSNNSQGQPIIYLLNCENRKTYQINLQENKDDNGNTKTDKTGNISYNATLNTELNLNNTSLTKVTTKLILSCNDLVAQNYSTYDIHKITGVGIISVNNKIKQQAKEGKSITYKNVLHLKQTTTLDEKIDNTESILEVRINNIQKPIKIDTALECEAIYYGYNLVRWAYMIFPTKDYNPNKTGLIKDEHYYSLPSDTYKGNTIHLNIKAYLQSHIQSQINTHQSNQSNIQNSNAQTNNSQPSSNSNPTNPPNYSQQLQYLKKGDYTLVIFAYLYSPAYKAKQYTTHTKLDYKPPLSLQFNGKELMILQWGEVKRDKLDSSQYDKQRIFQARSGIPLSITSKNNIENTSTKDSTTQTNSNNIQSHIPSTPQQNINNLILNPNNPKEYFDYSKQRQTEKNKGAIPEGIYYIDISKSTDNKQSGIRTYDNIWYSFSRSKEGEKQWGKYNIPIYTNKECTNTIESTTQRNNFYIHGGESYGDNGGIDLAKEDTRFFKTLESIKEEYKDILEVLKDNDGRIVVKLEVRYEERKNNKLYSMEDAKESLKIIYNKYGEEMARIIEKMYRSETAHFSSGQYKHTGTGGMEVFGNAPYYGWDSKFFEQNPNYKPTGVWSAFEGKGLSEQGGNAQVKDREKQFVVMPSVLAGMEYKAYYINKHNGNWARWHSTQTQAQEAYKKAIEQIKARIVDEIVGNKK